MKRKDLITLEDLSGKDIMRLLKTARKLKKAPHSRNHLLRNRTMALLFQKPSNRTRISFEVAAVHLGGYVLYLSPREIKMGEREPVKDVARVVSRYVDCVVARVFSHDDIKTFARHSDVPVINGLSDMAHPCQALSDLFTMMEKKPRLRKTTLAYVGDGNNVLNSLLMACAKTGVNIKAATPRGYEPDGDVLRKARVEAADTRSVVEITNDPVEAVKGADFVYTDVWTSMGQEVEQDKRLSDFEGFQINETLIKKAGNDPMIMHCLPAHRGQEVTDIIDGKNSIIYDQAENRLHMQKAVLTHLMT